MHSRSSFHTLGKFADEIIWTNKRNREDRFGEAVHYFYLDRSLHGGKLHQ